MHAHRPAHPDPLRRDRRRLLVLALLVLGLGLGLRDPWPADEPRFALVAEEMVETGQWLFPHRASQLYAHKPPLFMASIAVFYAVTGSMRIAFLLPSLLAGLLTVLLVHDLARRLWHRRAAWMAGLALLATIQFPLQARTAQIDASLTLWTTLGLYGLCRHLLLGPSWRWFYIAMVAMGLGAITKGVGFLPLLLWIPWFFARKQGWRGLTPPADRPRNRADMGRILFGLCLFVAAIGLWVLPMMLAVEASGDADLHTYRDEILWGQTAERYTSFQGHQRPLLYYPAQVIPVLWLPLSLLLPWSLPAWWRRLRRRDSRYLLLLGWAVLVVIFFTFSSGKRGVYILPALPAVALVFGPLLAAGLHRLRGPRRVGFAMLTALTVLLSGLAFAGWLDLPIARRLAAPLDASPWALLAACAVWGAVCLATFRPRRGFEALGVCLMGLWCLYGVWGYPLLNGSRTPQALLQQVDDHVGDGQLAMLGWPEQMILFADRPVHHWGFVDAGSHETLFPLQVQWAADWLQEAPRSRWLLLHEDWLESCFDAEGIDLGIRHRRHWWLIQASAVQAPCGRRHSDWPGEPTLYVTDWKQSAP